MPTPIILLPGIMGSRLYFSQSRMYWDPDSATRMFDWLPLVFRSDEDNRLALQAWAPAGVIFDSQRDPAHPNQFSWSTVPESFYSPLLKRFDSAAHPTYAVGYDWRQDIGWLGTYADNWIERYISEAGAQQAVIVTHSMGGLVLRAALLKRPALAQKIKAIVYVCQPSVGAVVLYSRMFNGVTEGEWGLRKILGNSRKGFLGNASGLPGAMELLPSAFFPMDANGDPWSPALGPLTLEQVYRGANSPPGMVPDYLQLSVNVVADLTDTIDMTLKHFAFLGDPTAVLHPETWLVYGMGNDTNVDVNFGDGSGGVFPDSDKSGDGTVPALSATALGLQPGRMIAVDKVEHSKACANNDVLDTIAAIFTQNNYV